MIKDICNIILQYAYYNMPVVMEYKCDVKVIHCDNIYSEYIIYRNKCYNNRDYNRRILEMRQWIRRLYPKRSWSFSRISSFKTDDIRGYIPENY